MDTRCDVDLPSDAMFWKLSCLFFLGIALGCLQVAGLCFFSLKPNIHVVQCVLKACPH